MIPPPGYQDPLETWSEKFARKFKENPWVPIGAFLFLLRLEMSLISKFMSLQDVWRHVVPYSCLLLNFEQESRQR